MGPSALVRSGQRRMLQEAQLTVLNQLLEDEPCSKGPCDETKALNFVRYILWDQVKLVDSAVELIDNMKANDMSITCYASLPVTNSKIKRRCFRVPGSTKGTEYTCYPNFCPCRSFFDMSKQSQYPAQTVMCKHLIAIRVATLLGLVTTENLPDPQFVQKFCQESTEGAHTNRRG